MCGHSGVLSIVSRFVCVFVHFSKVGFLLLLVSCLPTTVATAAAAASATTVSANSVERGVRLL